MYWSHWCWITCNRARNKCWLTSVWTFSCACNITTQQTVANNVEPFSRHLRQSVSNLHKNANRLRSTVWLLFACVSFQGDGIFQGESHGIKELVFGVVPDNHSAGFRPFGDVQSNVLYTVYPNMYRKMRLPILQRRELRGGWRGNFDGRIKRLLILIEINSLTTSYVNVIPEVIFFF